MFPRKFFLPSAIPLSSEHPASRLIEFSSRENTSLENEEERERERERERELSAQFETIRLAIKLGRNFGHYKSGLLTA